MNANNDITVKGCWPFSETDNTLKIALKNPDALAKKLIIESLKAENIAFSGQVVFGAGPNGLTTLVSHRSLPLKELLKPLLLDSNNIYAESITKTLGYEKYKVGSFQMGVKAIKSILKEHSKIDFDKMRLLDGSGLSRYNLIPPAQFGELLHAIYHNEKMRSYLIGSLPISGESGSLKAIDVECLKGKIKAKTGSLMGVSTLAGFLRPDASEPLVIVIMMDHIIEPSQVRQFENELCKIFMEGSLHAY